MSGKDQKNGRSTRIRELEREREDWRRTWNLRNWLIEFIDEGRLEQRSWIERGLGLRLWWRDETGRKLGREENDIRKASREVVLQQWQAAHNWSTTPCVKPRKTTWKENKGGGGWGSRQKCLGLQSAAVLRNQGPGARYKLRALLDFMMIIYMLQILKTNCELKPSKRAPKQ
jgi:hypothetical protein